MLSRRSLFGFGAALLAAPAIVRVASIMPVSVLPPELPMNPTEALVQSMIETKEQVAAAVLNNNMSVDRFREILLPGLRAIEARYAMFEDEYDNVYKSD